MTWLIVLAAAVLIWWAIARFYLDGPDLSRYDLPAPDPVNDAPSAGNDEVQGSVREFGRVAETHKGRARLEHLRLAMDAMGENADLTGIELRSVTVAGRPAEWVLAPERHSDRRLLYIHGGAFTMGSPLSHRAITTELARRTGLAVLAIDYRLMPEHPRTASIADCRAAYGWILANGPEGAAPAETLFVAGDSAGGNLTLMLIAWVRDRLRAGDAELRQADGAMALSPLTDATFSSPSLGRNAERDLMLGPMARMIQRVPKPLMLWFSWLQNRIRPNDPRLSPLYGDLSDLPPVLVQASEAEILIDDARRYVNKAREAGSPAELESWHGMVHVWQAFGSGLPESGQAFERLAAFVRRVTDSRDRASVA